MDAVTTTIGTALADLSEQIPLVLAVALPIALLMWAAPKLVGFAKRVVK